MEYPQDEIPWRLKFITEQITEVKQEISFLTKRRRDLMVERNKIQESCSHPEEDSTSNYSFCTICKKQWSLPWN